MKGMVIDMKKVTIISMLLLICISGCADTKETEGVSEAVSVTLETPNGDIMGLETDGISVYMGIPYADVSTRFAPPEDIKPWTEPLNCETPGASAMQMTPAGDIVGEESCAFLNVYTPAKATDEKLPVYVWIHGGAFSFGSGTEKSYDGTNYAKNGIVYVSINYRLNVLGFLATEETYNQYGTTGNWGFLDQLKALEWIRDNISAFGGDPDNVTIGGESAGSYAVSALILNPRASGLFKNAIMQSGSVLGIPANLQYARGNLKRSIEDGRQLAYTFEAADNSEGLNLLRNVEADVLVKMTQININFTSNLGYMMLPAFDGYAVPVNPYESLQNGDFNHVNLLWGYNKDEGSLFAPSTTDEITYKALLAKIFGYEKGMEIYQKYPSDANHAAYEQARLFIMHSFFATAMKPFGDALADAGMNVYAYRFNYETKENTTALLGAHHGSEIQYAFGNLPDNAADEQKQLSNQLFTRWVNFIKTGNPNSDEKTLDVEWQKYNAQKPSVLKLDKSIDFEPMEDIDLVTYMEDIMFSGDSFYLK